MATAAAPPPFQYISCLGYGSFGLVVKVETNNGSLSAVKIVFPDPAEEKSLDRECNIMKDRRHENILQIEEILFISFHVQDLEKIAEIVEDDSIHESVHIKLHGYIRRINRSKLPITATCIQMELCGPTLRKWLNQHVNSNKEDFEFQLFQINIIKNFIKGMKFLHRNNIIHRDFKPENVMFSHQKKDDTTFPFPLKIGDFGLCRYLHSETSKRLTIGRGSLDYMAPEMKGNEYSFQSDLFSMGLVMWEVIELIPFRTRSQLFNAIVNEERTDLIKPTFIPCIAIYIDRMTRRKLNERMEQINELNEMLFDIETWRVAKTIKVQEDSRENKNHATVSVFPAQTSNKTTTPSPPSQIQSSPTIKDPTTEGFLSRIRDFFRNKFVAKNAVELMKLVEDCASGDIINLIETTYYLKATLELWENNVSIIGKGPKSILRLLPSEAAVLKIMSANCVISDVTIEHKGIENCSLIKIWGKKNTLRNIILNGKNSDCTGVEMLEDYNVLQNIELSNMKIGIDIFESYSSITGVTCRDIAEGIFVIEDSVHCRIKNVNFCKTVSYIYKCPVKAIELHGSHHELDNIQCSLETFRELDRGICIKDKYSEFCRIINSICGPSYVVGNGHAFIDTDFGDLLDINGKDHRLIACKGDKLIVRSKCVEVSSDSLFRTIEYR